MSLDAIHGKRVLIDGDDCVESVDVKTTLARFDNSNESVACLREQIHRVDNPECVARIHQKQIALGIDIPSDAKGLGHVRFAKRALSSSVVM
jgi:hypothetical protein